MQNTIMNLKKKRERNTYTLHLNEMFLGFNTQKMILDIGGIMIE